MPRPNIIEGLYGPELHNILAEMEEVFPPLTAGPTDEIRHIMYRAGQHSVVDWLKKRLED